MPLVLPSSTDVSGLALLTVDGNVSLAAASGSVVSLGAAVTQVAPSTSYEASLAGPGQFTVPVGKVLKLGGRFSLVGGVRLVNSGTTEVMPYGGYDTGLSGGSVLENKATLTVDDSVYLRTVSSGTGSLVNDAGATINFVGTVSAGSSQITVPTTNNGTINDSLGQLVVDVAGVGASGSFNPLTGGLLILSPAGPGALTCLGFSSSGPGELRIYMPLVLPSSTDVSGLALLTVDSGVSLTAASGSVVSLGAAVTQVAPSTSYEASLAGPGQFTVPVGKVLKLGGRFSLVGGVRLVNSGTTEVMPYGGYDTGLSGGSVLENKATLTVDDSVYLRTVSSGTGSLVNDAGATINFAGSAQSSTASIGVPLVNNGTIAITQGTLLAAVPTLGASGRVAIGVASVGGPFPSFGQLSLGSSVSLTGTLAIQTAVGYAPPLGVAFAPVVGGAESGVFASVTGTQLTGVHWLPTYASSGVTLTSAAG
jgi:hypothetical protein